MLCYVVYESLPYIQKFLPSFVEFFTTPIIALWVLRFCERLMATVRHPGVPVMHLLGRSLLEKVVGYLCSRAVLLDWFPGFMLCLCFEIGCILLFGIAGHGSGLHKA